MRSIRRLYFYAVALLSLELVIWGATRLLRHLVSAPSGASSTNVLAAGLALALVGAPIFWLHWRRMQRESFRDEEERSCRIRALFLYGVLLATLIPAVQSMLGILTRQIFNLLDVSSLSARQQAIFGGNQSSTDNLIAFTANLIAAAYFNHVVQQDWQVNPLAEERIGVRRLYRYIWVTYGLALLVVGARLALGYLFSLAVSTSAQEITFLGNGLAFLLVGAPVFAWTWGIVQRSLAQPEEARSLLRLVFLYLVTLVSLAAVLTAAGLLLQDVVGIILGEPTSLRYLISGHKGSLGTLIPFGVLWIYFGGRLNRELAGLPDEPRRDSLRRLYRSVLAFLGTSTVFSGILALLYFFIRVAILASSNFMAERDLLASGITLLVIGLPLWLLPWRGLQTEAVRLDMNGDQARRSAVRKGYLYVILFLSVSGAMLAAGWTFYLVFNRLLGSSSSTFALQTAQWTASLVVVLVWLGYHLSVLQKDNRTLQRWLEERHARFPALIIQGEDERFTIELVQALQRGLPRLPISVHLAANGAPGENQRQAAVVILPARQAFQPNEPLRLWLNEYQGQRLVVPSPAEDWVWLGGQPYNPRETARQTAQAVRQLAEGQEVRPYQPTNSWTVAAYVLCGIMGLMILFFLFSLAASTID